MLDANHRPRSGLRSAGSEMTWSTGSEIWRYAPGDVQPELVHSMDGPFEVIDVARSARGYAFTERNHRNGAWRLSWLADGASEPIVVDHGVAAGALAPTIAIDDRRLAWAGFDEPDAGALSFLRVVDLEAPTAVRELLSLPIADGLLWYPVLDGGTLWFAIIHADFEGTGKGDEFHLETIALGDAGARPRRFAGVANDFEPAVSPTNVAWKTVEPGLAALTWGEVHILDRDTGETRRVPLPNLNHPSLGRRFLAFDEISRHRLLLFDLARGEVLEVPGPRDGSDTTFSGASLAGDLWTFIIGTDDGPRIGWARLPE